MCCLNDLSELNSPWCLDEKHLYLTWISRNSNFNAFRHINDEQTTKEWNRRTSSEAKPSKIRLFWNVNDIRKISIESWPHLNWREIPNPGIFTKGKTPVFWIVDYFIHSFSWENQTLYNLLLLEIESGRITDYNRRQDLFKILRCFQVPILI